MTVRKKAAKKRSARREPVRETASPELGVSIHRVAPAPVGRPRTFSSPEHLADEVLRYLEWVESNPLYEAKLVSYQGVTTVEKIPKLRAMTLAGLCLFLGISNVAWHNYRKRDGFVEVTAWAEEVIREQKFAGAAADLLNANIIARDLGLRDKDEGDGNAAQGLAALLKALGGSLPD